MQFARKNSESDIQVTLKQAGYECKDCQLVEQTAVMETEPLIIRHLREHIIAGHQVPGQVMSNIKAGGWEKRRNK